jgi:hypothetical protein
VRNSRDDLHLSGTMTRKRAAGGAADLVVEEDLDMEGAAAVAVGIGSEADGGNYIDFAVFVSLYVSSLSSLYSVWICIAQAFCFYST